MDSSLDEYCLHRRQQDDKRQEGTGAMPRTLTTTLGTIRDSRFLRHNAVFFAGSLAIGFLNYLYYPVMGRLLAPSNFGEVQTLFSLFAQINIFLSVLGLLTVNIVANYDDHQKRNKMIIELEKLGILIAGVLFLLTLLGASSLQHFFKFDSSLPFIVLLLAVVATVPLTFRNAYLRGRQFFGLVSWAGILAAAANIVVAVVLVKSGNGTAGAIAGLVIAQFAAFLFAARNASRQGFTGRLRPLLKLPNIRFVLPELKYAALVLLGSLAITGLYSVDIVAVKHIFDAHTAGLYAGISTIARVLFFLTASVAQVLMPAIKISQPIKTNQQTLLKSLVLLLAVGGSALLAFTIAPRLIITTLLGADYLVYAHLLPLLGLAIFSISILNLFIMYHMALRRYAIIPIVLLGMAATIVMLAANHQTLQAVVSSLLFGSVAMLTLLGTWLGGRKLKQVKVLKETT